MKKISGLFLCIVLAFLTGVSLWAKDIGLMLDQSVGNSGSGGSDAAGNLAGSKFDYSGTLVPRFSSFLGENGNIFISAGFKADYEDEDWILMPELLRTDLAWRFGDGEFRAGRMWYSDPLGYIAEGLFDGIRFSYDTASGSFSAGAWYTGLLSKKRAHIAMTAEELASHDIKPDYSDFMNTYFAPKRIISALGWDHPALGEILGLKLAILGQFDLSGTDKLNTQYLAGKLTLPVSAFVFDLGGCLEIIQTDEMRMALAGEFGAAWMLPVSFESRLSILGRYSSGVAEDSNIVAFLPVSTKTQGDILKTKLSGLSILSLDYLARLNSVLSAGLSSSYFIRSDWATYNEMGDDAEGYFVGNEFFARFFWNPASDMQITLGGGVFLPSLGDVAPKADPVWRAEINLILSLY